MNIGTVQTSGPVQSTDNSHQFRHALKTLRAVKNAFSEGNIGDAKEALAKLAKFFSQNNDAAPLRPSQQPAAPAAPAPVEATAVATVPPPPPPNTGGGDKLGDVFRALQSALKAGDMDAAQKAFKDLVNAYGAQEGRGRHRRENEHEHSSSHSVQGTRPPPIPSGQSPVSTGGAQSPAQIQIQAYTISISFTMVSVNMTM